MVSLTSSFEVQKPERSRKLPGVFPGEAHGSLVEQTVMVVLSHVLKSVKLHGFEMRLFWINVTSVK